MFLHTDYLLYWLHNSHAFLLLEVSVMFDDCSIFELREKHKSGETPSLYVLICFFILFRQPELILDTRLNTNFCSVSGYGWRHKKWDSLCVVVGIQREMCILGEHVKYQWGQIYGLTSGKLLDLLSLPEGPNPRSPIYLVLHGSLALAPCIASAQAARG